MRKLNTGWVLWFVLIVCLALSIAAFYYPSYVVQPYRAQGATELALALTVLRYRMLATSLLAATAIAATVWYWRKESRVGRRCAAIAGV